MFCTYSDANKTYVSIGGGRNTERLEPIVKLASRVGWPGIRLGFFFFL